MSYKVYTENPFKREYFEKELNWFMEKLQTIQGQGVEIKMRQIRGRYDGYMYRDFAVDLPEVPVLFIEGKLWMSITPMEVESHFVPIQCATGRVGVAGLGLGYYVQRILEKEDVEEVVVYELSQEVVDMYLANFGTHPKLTIVVGDVFENCKGEEFDWFYCDIYEEMCMDEAFDHMNLLCGENNIDAYHFWTQEAYVLSYVNNGNDIMNLPYSWRDRYPSFLTHLLMTKPMLVQDHLDGDEVERLIENIAEWVR